MNYEEVAEEIERADGLPMEAREKATDALAFVESLHQFFRETGMTTSEEPDLNELENLVDALTGELGAAVLFFCDPSFSRVPEMLRGLSNRMVKDDTENVVPPVVKKGFARLAKRIENTRVNSQQMAQMTVKAADSA